MNTLIDKGNPFSRNQCWKHFVVLSPALPVPGPAGEMVDMSGHSPVQSRRDFVLSALDFNPVRGSRQFNIS